MTHPGKRSPASTIKLTHAKAFAACCFYTVKFTAHCQVLQKRLLLVVFTLTSSQRTVKFCKSVCCLLFLHCQVDSAISSSRCTDLYIVLSCNMTRAGHNHLYLLFIVFFAGDSSDIQSYAAYIRSTKRTSFQTKCTSLSTQNQVPATEVDAWPSFGRGSGTGKGIGRHRSRGVVHVLLLEVWAGGLGNDCGGGGCGGSDGAAGAASLSSASQSTSPRPPCVKEGGRNGTLTHSTCCNTAGMARNG
jgi:hypothetical protein